VGSACGRIAENGPLIPAETCKSNQRRLFEYRVYLEDNREWKIQIVDEHLRSLSRTSAFFGHRPFEAIVIGDVVAFKDALRLVRGNNEEGGLSHSTVNHILLHGGAFYEWLLERPGSKIDQLLPEYFNLSWSKHGAAARSCYG
jgi:hypothetical protein